MRISDWSSDVCSSDLASPHPHASRHRARKQPLPRGGVPGWRKGGERTSPLGLLEKVDQFAELLFLFVSVTAGDRLCHAARGMALENRSEEHTSELQSLMRISYAVFCLKKQQHTT